MKARYPMQRTMNCGAHILKVAVVLVLGIQSLAPAQPSPLKANDLSASSSLGFPLGSRHVTFAQATAYVDFVARQSDRVQTRVMGNTATGKPLLLVTVSAPKNLTPRAHERRRRVNASLMQGEGASIPANHPMGAWFCMSIHGDEASGVEAGLKLLEFLATDDSQSTQKILENVVLFIEVIANPDGRSRFVHSVTARGGVTESLDQRSYSQNQPWPGGRTNHYLFDLNRDWFLQTQLESQARVTQVLREMPQVLADFHEMQTNRSYYFSTPPSEPINQHTSSQVREQWQRLGKSLRQHFDQAGWPYWTGDVFPADYPGYGGAWPIHLGIAGMTFEQATPRSGRVQREDGSVLTLNEAMERHAGAGVAVLEVCANQRATMLKTFAEHFSAQRKAAKSDPRPLILLSPKQAGSRLMQLAHLLKLNGIQVEQLKQEHTCKAEVLAVPGTRWASEADITFPAGTVVVSTLQPLRSLILTLLDPEIILDEGLLQAELARHKAEQASEIYDVASWNLPLLFGVDAYRIRDSDGLEREPLLKPKERSIAMANPDNRAPVAWALNSAAPFQKKQLVKLLTSGVKLRSAPQAFQVGNASFTAGTIVALADRNRDLLAQSVIRLMTSKGALIPLFTSQTAGGQALGSGRMIPLRSPKVLLLVGEGTNPYSAGSNWWFLDKVLGLPHQRAELGKHFNELLLESDVLILPHGSYLKSERGGLPSDALTAFLKRGGRILACEGALSALGKGGLGILGIERDLERSLKHSSFPGPIVSVRKQASKWLWNGLGNRLIIPLQLRGRSVFRLTKKEPAVVLARVEKGAQSALLSGLMLPHHAAACDAMPVLFHQKHGGGDILAFREDPTFRGTSPQWWQVLVNALLVPPRP